MALPGALAGGISTGGGGLSNSSSASSGAGTFTGSFNGPTIYGKYGTGTSPAAILDSPGTLYAVLAVAAVAVVFLLKKGK